MAIMITKESNLIILTIFEWEFPQRSESGLTEHFDAITNFSSHPLSKSLLCDLFFLCLKYTIKINIAPREQQVVVHNKTSSPKLYHQEQY